MHDPITECKHYSVTEERTGDAVSWKCGNCGKVIDECPFIYQDGRGRWFCGANASNLSSISEPDKTCNQLFPACPDYQKSICFLITEDGGTIVHRTKNRDGAKPASFVEKWKEEFITLKEEDGMTIACLSIFPLHDHCVCMYVTEKDGKFAITDGGETGGEMFINGYEMKNEHVDMVKRICQFHGVTVKQAKNDDKPRSIGELCIENISPRDVDAMLSRMFCVAVQVYALFAIR